ncbi:MAG: NAD(P)H-hydrate dehydratase [Chthoniobacterales bacterium]
MESPVVSSAEMRAAEEAAFARGITAEALMDQAGAGIAQAVQQFVPQPGHCIVFCGKGNNAGDALVAAKHLSACGWTIELRLAFEKRECGELMRKKLDAIAPSPRKSHGRLVLLDGLLGLGASPPLREPIRTACREINQLRHDANALVFAVDVPTGVDADSGEFDDDAVIADCTVTIGFAKGGLIADGALDHVGRIEIVPLSDLQVSGTHDATLAAATSLRGLLPRRKFGAYKNQFGRVGVVAGSRGLTGAAVLCATGALRGGAGLVNLFVTDDVYEIIAAIAPPETMVRGVSSYHDLADRPVNVWAIGPGLGKERADEVRHAIRVLEQPVVVDADGLNIAAETPEIWAEARGPRLITPHPGEMKRLSPNGGEDRATQARRFVAGNAVTLLLKGSRTIVAERGKPLSYNTTGTPAMASGGMGDVLTGVCAALISQHLSCYDAARLASWACARAAEISLGHGGTSEESLIATDVIRNLGRAFNELRAID